MTLVYYDYNPTQFNGMGRRSGGHFGGGSGGGYGSSSYGSGGGSYRHSTRSAQPIDSATTGMVAVAVFLTFAGYMWFQRTKCPKCKVSARP